MKRTTRNDPELPIKERLTLRFIAGLSGDVSAYHSFLNDLTGQLRGFLKTRIRYPHDDVEDIVQDILLSLHNSRHTYRIGEPAITWMHALACYKLMNFHRARLGRQALDELLNGYPDIFAGSDEQLDDSKCDVHSLLKQSPDQQRLRILCTMRHGHPVNKMARITSLHPTAIKMRIRRRLKAVTAKIRGAK